MKMEFEFDENRIIEDGEYSLEEFYEKIDNVFYSKKIIQKDEFGNHIGPDDNDNYVYFARVLLTLKNSDWFRKYVKEWLWYINGRADDVMDALKIAENQKKNVKLKKKLHLI